MGWIKINTDGLSKGNPCPATCAVVYQDADGRFLGGFGMPLDVHSSSLKNLGLLLWL